MSKAIITKIAAKFQVTVPPEIRGIFDLQEGDLFQWEFDEPNAQLLLIPKRAQLLTPMVKNFIGGLRAKREKAREEAAKEPQKIVAKASSAG